MAPGDWNDTQLCRIMTGWSLSDLDQLANPALFGVQARIVEHNLDAEALVREISASGAEVFYFHAKSHSGNLWFVSRHGRTFSALGGRDWVGELVTSCRRHGLSTVCMFQVVCDQRAYDEHPDWRQINEHGKPAGVSPRVCFNHSDYRAYILGLIAEVTAGYDIQAVMIDELDFNGRHGGGTMCYCDHCRRLFRARFGGDPPRVPDWDSRRWKQFVRWRFESLTAFIAAVRGTVKRIKPDVLLTIVSYSGKYLPWTRLQPVESFCEQVDYFSLDIVGDIHLSAYCRFFRCYSSAKAEIISQIMSPLGRFFREPTLPVRSQARNLCEAMTIVANNLSWNMDVSYMPLPADQALSPAVLAQYGVLSAEIDRRREWLVGKQESVAEVALFYSEDSKVFYGQDDVPLYADEFMGYFKALLENQILFDIIGAAHLRPALLERYRAIVMPNAVCLGDAQVAALEEFVANGGGLVASYKTSLFDEDGERRDDFALSTRLGVSFARDGPEGDFVLRDVVRRARDGEFDYGFFRMLPDRGLDQNIGSLSALWAPVAIVTPLGDALTAGEYYHRQGTVGNHIPGFKKSYVPGEAECLAALRPGPGGRAAYVAAKFGGFYLATGFRYAARAIVNTVRWVLAGPQQIEISAPRCIESTAFCQGGRRIVVHLVNYQSVPERGELGALVGVGLYEADDILPVHGIEIRICGDIVPQVRRAYIAPECTELELRALADGSRLVRVPEVAYHAMLVLELHDSGMR